MFLTHLSLGQEADELSEGLLYDSNRQEQDLRTHPLRIKSPVLDEYLKDLVCRLDEGVCSKIRIYVLTAPGFNAFMMPNGVMGVHSGLLLRSRSEDEIAAVLGHEIGHYVKEHTLQSVQKRIRAGNVLGVIGAIVSAASTVSVNSATSLEEYYSALDLSHIAIGMVNAANIYTGFMLLAHDRGMETESDEYGLKLLQQGGFDPMAAATVWERAILEDNAAEDQPGFSLLSTHPTSQDRLENLSSLVSNFPKNATEENTSDGDFLDIMNSRRQEWLEHEMRVLYPPQFEELVRQQEEFFGFSDGYSYHLKAKSWEHYSEMSILNASKKKNALEKAQEHYQEGSKTHGMPNDAYRDWGRVSIKLDNNQEAITAFKKYLEISPDAWDARFLRRQLNNLENINGAVDVP